MSQPGLGAMIHYLGGGSANSADKYYGRKIIAAHLDKENDFFEIGFEDGVRIKITDEGQSCCEHRYMTCDDKPADLVGKTLKAITVKEGPDQGNEYDVHEVAFLEVQVDDCSITFATHNEHNGYYGGFGLNIREFTKEGETK